jgi:hypothetical protein
LKGCCRQIVIPCGKERPRASPPSSPERLGHLLVEPNLKAFSVKYYRSTQISSGWGRRACPGS